MPWVRIDETAMDHPKFLALTDGAWRLWCEGQAYCQKHLTDGQIATAALKGFRYYSAARVKMLTSELVPGKGPCWHQGVKGIGVHHYLDWNDSAAEVIKARADAKDRQRRHRNGDRHVVTNDKQTPNTSSGVCVSGSSGSEKEKGPVEI